MEKPKYYILEYMEDILSDWSMAEIRQMHKYLSIRPNNVLIITKIEDMLKSNDEENIVNIKHLAELIKSSNDGIIKLCVKGLKECFNEQSSEFEIKVSYNLDTKEDGNQVIALHQEKVCLLDLRGKKILEPSERKEYDAFVFGGILGDHPPKDRTFALRPLFTQSRNLQEVQMSTDTALLVTELIINAQINFNDIPFIENPEIVNEADPNSSVVMEGFKYISDRLDIKTLKISDNQKEQPLMSDVIKNDLLFLDFDFNLM